MHGLSFYTFLGYHANFFDTKVSITILHFAICTYRNFVNLACVRTENVFEEKNTVSVKFEDSFSDKS